MPLLWTEIEAWTHLYRIAPKEWELDLLIELDDLWLKIMSKEAVTADDLREEGQAEDDDEEKPDPFAVLKEA